MNIFLSRDLDIWPMTLTYEIDLAILPLDLHAKIQVCTSVRSAVKVVTDRRTDTRCQNYYIRHVTDVGCIKSEFVIWECSSDGLSFCMAPLP